MSVPSMVHRSGDTLVVRSVVSGDALFGSEEEDCTDKSNEPTEKDLPECKVKRNYSCGSCDFFTQNPRSYLYHLRDIHNEKVRIYECPSCLYASKHFQKLIRHTRMVHGSADGEVQNRKGKKRPLQTPEDLEEANESPTSADESQPANLDDEETAVEKSGLKCSVCTFVAKNHAQLNKHERDEHIKTKFFRCAKCTYVTHMKARFTKHVKYHSMPMIKCDMCDFRTPYKWNLDRHCKNHNGKGAFRCSACNFTADIKQSLTVHEMNHHVPPVGQAAGLGVGRRRNKVGASDTTAAEEVVSQVQSEPEQCETAPSGKSKLKIPAKKPKAANSQDFGVGGGGSDFVHPDDIVQHANGNVYIKTKCRFCNFKTAWDGEMARHEERTHAHLLSPGKKKPPRPVPNLIPISPPKQPKQSEPAMSQKDMNEICEHAQNSALKDFASLFNSEEIFSKEKSPKKNPSIFDKMKEQISGDPEDLLTCRLCGHESKCLSESCAHKKTCGKESAPSLNMTTIHTLSSTRCQYCRQRCKSSKDLLQHLQTCASAVKYFEQESETADDDNDQLHIVTEEDNSRSSEKDHPHPMENKVFVWNNIDVPMDTSVGEPSYEYVEDKAEDNISLDLSTRTQSPCSEASNLEVIQPVITTTPTPTPTITTDKIPTHGNDISIAQHKRVFKCPHCTFWASTASRFHVHIVGHLNKKPFECSLCAYRSNWRWDITKHIKLKSVRDPAHESAKVLMTDETGRRNYTKYNKYLTEIPLPGGVDNHETSGGNGTRPRQQQQQHHQPGDLPKAGKNPGSSEFSTLLSKVSTNKPLPALKTPEEFFNKVEKKRPQNDKKTLWQCKKCNFRDPCKEKLLLHVKGHVNVGSPQSQHQQLQQQPQPLVLSLASCSGTASSSSSPSSSSLAGIGNQRSATSGPAGIGDDLDTEASVGGSGLARGQAPFRCGHCHQVSNWKHVIQRHCRLKHSGDIKVIVASKTYDKIETDSFSEDLPEHSDVFQEGQFKCRHCPFASDDAEDYQTHADGHNSNTPLKCFFCGFSVSAKDDLYQHIRLHGVFNHNEYIQKLDKQLLLGDVEPSKRHKCTLCPYVTNSKSQFSYHKQFHQQKNGQYRCTMCSYNVSKRHLLHQHMKVHGISISPQKQNGETIDLEDMSEEIEEIQPQSVDWQSLQEIPLVWVSKSGKLSKMYKCRYCPHVNLRKVNIQEHEKMHGLREKSVSRGNETEHRCPECNYVCNNAGVLSSHSKVHQGLYGTVHGVVDTAKTDEEQIRELGNLLNTPHTLDTIEMDDDLDCRPSENNDTLHFCSKCPARFIRENEYKSHVNSHAARLNYCCDYCSYSVRQKQPLLAHAKVHTKEYRERTKALLETCIVRPEYPPPDLTYLPKSDVWVVDESFDLVAVSSVFQGARSRMSVPLSGTELFQQKSEAEASECAQNYFKDAGKFDFAKNGREDEPRRYKCPKCANSFESYELCKRHIELHNFKAVVKEEIKEEVRTSDDESIPEDMSMPRTIKESSPPEAKKPYWCQKCPYSNQRRDSVENHQKRHVGISGVQNTHTCQHCDYSVPQNYFLREHNKLHFAPQNKPRNPDAYMSCESMRLSTKILLKEEEEEEEEENQEDEEEGMDFSNKEDLGCGLVEGDNNNESEKVYVNVKSGQVLDTDVTMEAAS